MARFKNTDNSQGLFLPVNLEEQLLPGTFEWTLNYLFDRMDLSIIAAFVSTKSDAVKELFTQVLLQCHELKLIIGEMFAINGCK